MKPSELKKWMAANDKSALDVASLTGVAFTTVLRFLSGEVKRPHGLTLKAFRDLVERSAA